jgi:hypothetical protein
MTTPTIHTLHGCVPPGSGHNGHTFTTGDYNPVCVAPGAGLGAILKVTPGPGLEQAPAASGPWVALPAGSRLDIVGTQLFIRGPGGSFTLAWYGPRLPVLARYGGERGSVPEGTYDPHWADNWPRPA